ncbi:MAG: ABC-type spermidine/putrescine transport system, permease component I [Halorubrum sp. J07HR59]|nr:MAG: ABC-type spermidine/putrescine transport system, permease component I [Halorubrum sp. J07HR59]
MSAAVPGIRDRLGRVSNSGSALILPLVLFDLLVFVVPFGYLLRIALTERSSTAQYNEGTWSIDGFGYVLTEQTLTGAFLFTLGFAVLVTVISVAVSTMYAYAIWRADGLLRVTLLVGVLMSMFTAIVVKLFAAILVFSPNGVLNTTLIASGAITEPIALVNNLSGAVIGQLYIVVPYTILAVYSVLSTIDESLIEAGRDLGAGPVRTFREVVVPHTVPGMLVGGVISFTWSVGSYAAPLLLGSGAERTVGVAVADLLLRRFDWAAAASLGVLVTVTVFVALAVAYIAVGRTRGPTNE